MIYEIYLNGKGPKIHCGQFQCWNDEAWEPKNLNIAVGPWDVKIPCPEKCKAKKGKILVCGCYTVARCERQQVDAYK